MRRRPSSNEATLLLQAWGTGNRAALDKLTPIVYQQLRRLARIYLNREYPGHSLQASQSVLS